MSAKKLPDSIKRTYVFFALLFMTMTSLLPGNSMAQGTNMSDPIVMGTYGAGTYSYSDTRNNSGYGDDYGQNSPDIFYKFTVQGTTDISISTCSSGFDTYLHLLDVNGGLITSDDDNGPLCSGLTASIAIPNATITSLAAGTYYIVAEGYWTYTGTIYLDVNLTVQSSTPTVYDTRNFIRTWEALYRETDGNVLITKELPDVTMSTTYLDGLGRPIQSVEKGVSPGAGNTWNDIVKHYEYDVAGRAVKDYLPYATAEYPGVYKPNAGTVQPQFVRTFFNEPSTAPTYKGVEYDNSPLNRITKTMAPGQSWGGSGVGIIFNYDFNNSNSINEKVHIWNLDYSSAALPVTNSTLTYPAGKLLKNITSDEHNNQVITYTDFSGNVILKKVQEADPGSLLTVEHSGWVCTYYVYDDFGLLRYVITPKAVQYLDNNGWNLTQNIVDELCYRYQYDEKGRLVVKKKPGAGDESMVYDKKDRLVLSQDANQKSKNQWSFSLYDNLSRSVATGLFDNSATRQTMQSHVNTLANGSQTNSVFVGNGIYQTIIVDNPIAGSTGTNTYCNGCTASTVTYNSVTHYDDYGYSNVKAFNTNNTLAYSSSSDPQIEPTVKTGRTRGFVTGEKIRILDADNNPLNDKFIFSTAYYDEQGRSLQNLTDNIKNGNDYQTNQYNFSENMVSSFVSHNNGTETFTVTTKNEFDRAGRPTKLYKNFNNTFYKQLSEYSYDAFGQIKNKRLAPGYTGSGTNEIESIDYSYNIRGWLTGINKDYALSNDNYSQWNKYFGMYVGYDNSDNLFAQPRLNGNITGTIWKSQGDNSPRKYDYTYDRMDRFASAIFKQKKRPTDSWLNTEVDFSAYVEYEDQHGNIKTMKHMGVIPGVSSPVIVDMLNYFYNSIAGTNNLKGNKLIKVDDIGHGLGTKNGMLGDFKDAVTASEEYFYDDNGNLVKDLNKNITDPNAPAPQNGVTYNFLNKPDKIVIPGKSTIEFTYDASGEKLSKKVTPAAGTAKTTYYISDFVYEENTLQFVLHEEGRLKIITSHTKVNDIDYDLNAGNVGITWPGGKQGVFEYFLKDHLGSTRMVLTEEVQKEYYKATMESNIASTENQLFGKVNFDGSIPTNNEMEITRLANSCGSTPWPGNCSNLAKLTAAEANKSRGPNLILKVMAGDIISTRTDYFYLNNNSNGPAGNALNDVLLSLVGAITSPGKGSELGKSQQSEINTSLLNNSQLQQFISDQNTTGVNNEPKAYLNIIFLDEQFKYVEADINTPDVGSGSLRVSQANNPSAYLFMQKKAPKNGWVFVYLSNQSNESVYFDNFNVVEEHSRIAEESHYYPYGLKIAGISSKAFNKLENKYGYQGDFTEEETETGWNEFFLRMYDPQIGRWTSADPYDQYPSPYLGMGDNPITGVDPTGGFDYIRHADANGNVYVYWDSRVHGASEFLALYGNKLVGGEEYEWLGPVRPCFCSGSPGSWGATEVFFNTATESIEGNLENLVLSSLPRKAPVDNRIVNLDGAKVATLEYEKGMGWDQKASYFVANTVMGVWNGAVNLLEAGLNPHVTAQNIYNGTASAVNYVSSHSPGEMANDFSYFIGNSLSNPHTYENLFSGAMMAKATLNISKSGRISNIAKIEVEKKIEVEVSKVFIVTPEGVALPKGAFIPAEFMANPYRSSSYGIFENGKFVEKLRIDPATPPGMKGPNYSHYHLNGGSTHKTGDWPWNH